jgi:hypothetical protein
MNQLAVFAIAKYHPHHLLPRHLASGGVFLLTACPSRYARGSSDLEQPDVTASLPGAAPHAGAPQPALRQRLGSAVLSAVCLRTRSSSRAADGLTVIVQRMRDLAARKPHRFDPQTFAFRLPFPQPPALPCRYANPDPNTPSPGQMQGLQSADSKPDTWSSHSPCTSTLQRLRSKAGLSTFRSVHWFRAAGMETRGDRVAMPAPDHNRVQVRASGASRSPLRP